MWETTINNFELPLINPHIFTLPITQPNTQGRETEYQARLEHIRSLPNNIQIQDHYWDSVDSTTQASTPGSSTDTDYWSPRIAQFASPVISIHSPDTCPCSCGIDVCYCNDRQPGTPPTPSYITLWKPRLLSRPINGVHYNREVQTGALTSLSPVSRPPEITIYPRVTPVRTF